MTVMPYQPSEFTPEGRAYIELQKHCSELQDEVARLQSLINTPHTADFMQAVQLEAAHQRERWGVDHDAGKEDSDWFWLIGYLAGKAIRPDATPEKRLHHIITTAAACLNWHAARSGADTRMRPGIEPPVEPSARQCNHGAISPKGTMFYHGYVQPKANLWRCDVCKGLYEGNLTDPNTPGSQSLTLVGPSEPPPAVDVAPIAKLTVRDGLVQRAGLYAPGLPDGDHDVFPVPISPKGELRPHVLAEPPSAWQPIETAPQDGRNIILAHYAYVTEGYRRIDGVHVSHQGDKPLTPFSHWMPLPSPPVTKSEIPAAAQSAANSGQCESRKAAQSGTAAGASVETDDRQWLIRKRGYYYRPDRAGYTANIADAGRYTEAEAKAEAAIEPSIMQAIHISQAVSETDVQPL